MMQINSKPIEKITEKSAKTSDDFLELAYETDSEAKAISYVKKAIALDEDNLDAIGLRIELTARDTIDALKQYEKAVAHGTKVMEKKGFLKDSVGRFWGVLETRPYMRLRSSYADILIECSMFKKAIGEYEDMIRLNETWQREVEKMNDYGYCPFSIEEYVTELLENSFLFKNCSAYFIWAANVMKI
jgi:tetratricopeptide (TPR) repeat protein